MIDGTRITEVAPHRDDLHRGTVVDASAGTVVPGLIESHAHLSKALGEAQGRILLSFGVTSVRNPATNAIRRAGGARGDRVGRTGRAARLHHRRAARRHPHLLPGRRRARRRRPRRCAARARDDAPLRLHQDLRAAARPAAEAGDRGRAPRRDAGDLARDLSRGGLRRRRRRAHPRHQPPRVLAEDERAAPLLPGRDPAADRVGDDDHADHRHPGRQPAAHLEGRELDRRPADEAVPAVDHRRRAGAARQAGVAAGPGDPRGAGRRRRSGWPPRW